MNEITKTGNGSPVDIEKIRTYLKTLNLTTNLTPTEEQQFIEIALAYGLNPFKREIYASKYGGSFSIIVGFETYIKRAERSGRLSGWNVRTEGEVDYANVGKTSIRAIITIFRKDFAHPFVHEVHFEEYAQRTKDGYLNKFWREKPITMLKKVAMAQGFRLCFSDELGGLPYTSEEIGVFTGSSEVPAIELPSPTPSVPTPVAPPVELTPPAKPKKEKKAEEKPKKVKEEVVSEPESVTTDEDISKEFDAITLEIDKAESIDDLKAIYQKFVAWSSDGEFLGRLSVKRKEIEYREEEIRRRKLAEPPLEVKVELESRPANNDGELF